MVSVQKFITHLRVLIIRKIINTILVAIEKSVSPDQTVQSNLGLHCLPGNEILNFYQLPYLTADDNSLRLDQFLVVQPKHSLYGDCHTAKSA